MTLIKLKVAIANPLELLGEILTVTDTVPNIGDQIGFGRCPALRVENRIWSHINDSTAVEVTLMCTDIMQGTNHGPDR